LIYLYVASYLSVYMSIFIYLYLLLIKNKLASRWEPAIKFVSLHMKLFNHTPTNTPIIKLNNQYYITHHDVLSNEIFHPLHVFGTSSIKHPKFNVPFNLIKNPPQDFISNLA